jgi:hypothetical protein
MFERVAALLDISGFLMVRRKWFIDHASHGTSVSAGELFGYSPKGELGMTCFDLCQVHITKSNQHTRKANPMIAWFILLVLGPFITISALMFRQWTVMIIFGIITVCAYLPFFLHHIK